MCDGSECHKLYGTRHASPFFFTLRHWTLLSSPSKLYVLTRLYFLSRSWQKAGKIKEWLEKQFHDYVTSSISSFSSPYLSTVEHYWDNKLAHNTKDLLKIAIRDDMASMNKEHLINACNHFRRTKPYLKQMVVISNKHVLCMKTGVLNSGKHIVTSTK